MECWVGEGNGTPLQSSCLENPRDGWACWAALCGVAQGRTRLSDSAAAAECWVLAMRLCPTLCHPRDCSPPGSSVHGILQARILEWVVIPFSRGSSQPRNRTQVSCTAGRFSTTWATREAQYSSMCVLVPTSSSSLPPLSPLETLSSFSTSVTLFLFSK